MVLLHTGDFPVAAGQTEALVNTPLFLNPSEVRASPGHCETSGFPQADVRPCGSGPFSWSNPPRRGGFLEPPGACETRRDAVPSTVGERGLGQRGEGSGLLL